ncbi:MAG: ABC transporter permease [Pseudomonadota bacterium]
MPVYILRRLLLMIPTLLGITMVVFAIMAAAPGGISPQSLIAGQEMDPEAREALEDYYNRLYGLDQPPPVQYLRWLNNISPVGFTQDEAGDYTGFSLTKGVDLGTSFRYGRPVTDLIAERLPITLILNAVSIPLVYVLAIAIGLHAATRQGRAFDTGSGLALLALWSVPTMLAGVLLIGFFASDQFWQWFPTAGFGSRQAGDMPFLPHWGSGRDALLTVLGAGLGSVAGVAVARLNSARARAAMAGVAGLLLGAAWALSLGDPGVVLFLALALFTAAVIGGAAWLDFSLLRVTTLGLTGLLAGLLLVMPLMEGDLVRGFLLDRAWHLVLPVITLAYGGIAFLAKLTRSSVLENIRADYARTARAKGLGEDEVLWRHVFRNSLLPLITVAATLLPAMLSGSVIVESIFSLEGMGKLAVEAVMGRDRELVLSVTLISGLLTLAGYLLADVLYAVADPRVSYD